MISKLYSILIGMDYSQVNPSYPPLPNCSADLAAIEELLTTGPLAAKEIAEPIIMLSSKVRIDVSVLSDAIDSISHRVNSSDALLFYYSGHGTPDHALVLEDSQMLPIDSLKILLSRTTCRLKVLVLDACHLGTNPGIVKSSSLSVSKPALNTSRVMGTVTLASSTASQPSHSPLDARQPSYFTQAFIRAAKYGTARWYEELLSMIRLELSRTCPDILQDPVLTLNATGSIPLFMSSAAFTNTNMANGSQPIKINTISNQWYAVFRGFGTSETHSPDSPPGGAIFVYMYDALHNEWHLRATGERYFKVREGTRFDHIKLRDDHPECSMTVGNEQWVICLSNRDLIIRTNNQLKLFVCPLDDPFPCAK